MFKKTGYPFDTDTRFLIIRISRSQKIRKFVVSSFPVKVVMLDFSAYTYRPFHEASVPVRQVLRWMRRILLTDGLADPLDGTDLSGSAVIGNQGSESVPTEASTVLQIGGTDVTVNWNEISSPSVGGIVLQIGDTKDQTLKVSIKSAKASDLGIDQLNVMSQDDANNSMELCKNAINSVSEMRSALGAYQNRLEHTMSSLANTVENAQNAKSRIRDLDMAKGMTSYMKNNVLTQASQFLLAQINQQPSQVLQLLN